MLKKWIFVGLASCFILSGCNKSEEKQAKPVEVEEEPPMEEVIDQVDNSVVFPLTGMKTENVSTDRAYAVMVNNDPKARQQSGLHKADLVYEILAEGNVTRFMAIFQSETPTIIGPVRSARDYYIDLAQGYHALYVAHGYSEEAQKMLASGVVDNINGMQYDGSLFKRVSFRKAPHNSYITPDNILKGAKQLGFEMKEAPSTLPFYTEEELETLTGEAATAATVRYYSSNLFKVDYKYDNVSKKYARYSNNEPTTDYDTGTPIVLDNVFIVEMEHVLTGDGVHREIDLTSGGRGILLQHGKQVPVDWKNIDGRILPFSNGVEVKLVPGKTWINIIPTDPGLDQSVMIQS